MKIIFLIRSLNPGGAERQLVNLAISLKDRGYKISVCIYYPGGSLENELRQNNVEIYYLEKKSRWNILSFFLSLIRFIRKEKPDIIYAYLSTANVISVLLKPIFKNVRVIWGIRASNMDLSQYDRIWQFSYFLERKLSRFSDLIIVNSYAGMTDSEKNGFQKEKMVVIHNGIDTTKFNYQPQLRQKIRKEWNIEDHEILIGLVARLDPKKDHQNFIIASSILAKEWKNIKFICIGRGDKNKLNHLKRLSMENGLYKQLLWAGPRTDMPAVYNGLDILCMSSSFGEGFPNVIGEAMACGLPCVATDVGDSALIVCDIGIIVPPNQPQKLAEGLLKMIAKIENNKTAISKQARQFIIDMYKTEKMVSHTESVLNEIVQ